MFRLSTDTALAVGVSPHYSRIPLAPRRYLIVEAGLDTRRKFPLHLFPPPTVFEVSRQTQGKLTTMRSVLLSGGLLHVLCCARYRRACPVFLSLCDPLCCYCTPILHDESPNYKKRTRKNTLAGKTNRQSEPAEPFQASKITNGRAQPHDTMHHHICHHICRNRCRRHNAIHSSEG